MKLIVGLGNPGEKYKKTRHNLGFMAVERFVKDYPLKTKWNKESKFKSEIVKMEWKPRHGELTEIILAKPQSFMNNSGMAVSLISKYFNIQISDIWIVYDDVDLPLGSMKIRYGGASAGHRGVESVIEALGTDKFWRFRMGIGIQNQRSKPQKDIDDYVLGMFKGSEWGKAKELIKKGSDSLQAALEDGLESAMNRFNTK